MKLFFDHITGKLTNYDFIYSLALAKFEEKEYCQAFENGWIPLSWYYTKLDELTWINARNTRLLLSKFTRMRMGIREIGRRYIHLEVIDLKAPAFIIVTFGS